MSINGGGAIISFTFDDFPLTALSVGGAILRKWGVAGTYYASLDLAGKDDAAGQMFDVIHLKTLLNQGHELGCHTYNHFDSSTCPTRVFIDSIEANQRVLDTLVPGARFRTFSFPKSAPRPRTKQRVGTRFACCRGGGQTFNTGEADLNYLRAYFLEQAQGSVDIVKQVVDQNRAANGWLIFATHDVCERPSRFGCTPDFFETVVRYSVESGARILPVIHALEQYRSGDAI